MLQQERNRQAALTLQMGAARVVAASLAAVLLSLETAQCEIQSAIKAHLKAHPALKAKKQRLLSVPGIGRQTVLHVLVLLARWETLTDGTGRAKGLVLTPGWIPRRTTAGAACTSRPAFPAWAIARSAAVCISPRSAGCVPAADRCGISTAGWSAVARPKSWR